MSLKPLRLEINVLRLPDTKMSTLLREIFDDRQELVFEFTDNDENGDILKILETVRDPSVLWIGHRILSPRFLSRILLPGRFDRVIHRTGVYTDEIVQLVWWVMNCAEDLLRRVLIELLQGRIHRRTWRCVVYAVWYLAMKQVGGGEWFRERVSQHQTMLDLILDWETSAGCDKDTVRETAIHILNETGWTGCTESPEASTNSTLEELMEMARSFRPVPLARSTSSPIRTPYDKE